VNSGPRQDSTDQAAAPLERPHQEGEISEREDSTHRVDDDENVRRVISHGGYRREPAGGGRAFDGKRPVGLVELVRESLILACEVVGKAEEPHLLGRRRLLVATERR
jgi:hypothetical protein